MSNPVLSQITLPSGTTYDIKDAQARADIAAISGAIAGGVTFMGETITPLEDGSTTTQIIIKGSGSAVTAIKGWLVVYGEKEFIFDGTQWLEFGDIGGLGALAYKSSASGSYTPTGTVSQPTFSGNSMSSTGSFTPAGSVTLTNTNQNATVAPAASGTATYTPSGSVSAPTISVASAGATATIKNPTGATVATAVNTSAPGSAAPPNALTYYSVSGETLSLYQLGYTTGNSITTENVTVKTGDASYEASAPTFSGTGVRLETDNISIPTSASFTGTADSISVSGTPTGTVSQPTFAGTENTITVS